MTSLGTKAHPRATTTAPQAPGREGIHGQAGPGIIPGSEPVEFGVPTSTIVPDRSPRYSVASVPPATDCPVHRDERHVRHPVDIHVGTRIRLRRNLLGMSQKTLAEAIGITFQQVQKFERGVNRIAAGRLHTMARVLDVPISFFFDDMASGMDGRAPSEGVVEAHAADNFLQIGHAAPARGETLDLVRAYRTIRNAELRRRVLDLVRSLAPPER